MGRPRTKNHDLPKNVYLKGKCHWYKSPSGEWINLTKDQSRAVLPFEHYEKPAEEIPTTELRIMWRAARSRAAKKGLEFSISADWILARFVESGRRCAVSGLRFSFEKGPTKNRPFVPSIDRIDSKNGYTPENCRLVCWCVNAMLAEFGLRDMLRIAAAIARHQGNTLYSRRLRNSVPVSFEEIQKTAI